MFYHCYLNLKYIISLSNLKCWLTSSQGYPQALPGEVIFLGEGVTQVIHLHNWVYLLSWEFEGFLVNCWAISGRLPVFHLPPSPARHLFSYWLDGEDLGHSEWPQAPLTFLLCPLTLTSLLCTWALGLFLSLLFWGAQAISHSSPSSSVPPPHTPSLICTLLLTLLFFTVTSSFFLISNLLFSVWKALSVY